VFLHLSERRWQFHERRAVAKGTRFALNDGQIVPPVANRLCWQMMAALDHAGMFAQDAAFGRQNQPVGIASSPASFSFVNNRKIISVIHQPVPFDQLHQPRLMPGAAEPHDARGPQLDRDLRLALAVALEQDPEHQFAQPPRATEQPGCTAEMLEHVTAEVPRTQRTPDVGISVLVA
jgi:hypothetical protein